MARPARRLGNLPAEPTTFIGRRRELAEIKRKLGSAHLVSVVGAGGVGKTRLAIHLAGEVARRFKGGAWFVELAELQDAGLVAAAAMTALDLRDQTAAEPLDLLLAHLRDREVLLVVDSCEHLLESVAELVTQILEGAPGVRMIATSREPLSVAGEHVVSLPPLELPAAGPGQALAELRQNEAVALFVERAAAASGSFKLTPENQETVVELCRRLDGLPLAIELAAVRTRVLGVSQIVHRLNDRFAILTGGSRAALPRHQTLLTTIDWSYGLLSSGEQALLRRLFIFAGRFTLEDVEAVCADSGSPGALDLLTSLVERSLVIKEETKGVACYRLHETMREYTRRRSRDAGDEEAIEERCAGYLWQRCESSAAAARFDLVEWLAWMDLEIDNIRWVLRRFAGAGDFQRGIDVATALRYFWITRATSEGVRWLDEMLASGAGDAESRSRAHYVRGLLATLQADPIAASRALMLSVAAARESRRPALLSVALSMLSIAQYMTGDAASGRSSLGEARILTGSLDDFLARVTLLQARSLIGLLEADLEAVGSAASEGVCISREQGDLYSLEMMLMNMGGAALGAGDAAAAKPLYEEGLQVALRIDDRVAQVHFVDALGIVAAGSGQARVAARLLGAAETMRAAAGARAMGFVTARVAMAREEAILALGQARFDSEYETGGRMSREAAVTLALGHTDAPAHPAARIPATAPLARREADVARLVAEGLTNRQIGARLFIGERTVDSHVRSILNKLGFNTRAQIAAWVATSSLT